MEQGELCHLGGHGTSVPAPVALLSLTEFLALVTVTSPFQTPRLLPIALGQVTRTSDAGGPKPSSASAPPSAFLPVPGTIHTVPKTRHLVSYFVVTVLFLFNFFLFKNTINLVFENTGTIQGKNKPVWQPWFFLWGEAVTCCIQGLDNPCGHLQDKTETPHLLIRNFW